MSKQAYIGEVIFKKSTHKFCGSRGECVRLEKGHAGVTDSLRSATQLSAYGRGTSLKVCLGWVEPTMLFVLLAPV